MTATSVQTAQLDLSVVIPSYNTRDLMEQALRTVAEASGDIGVEVIVLAFAVVVIGGMGSMPGAMVGSVVVGLSRAAAVHLFPEIELFVIYAIMAAVLAFRPEGLFAPAATRKI